MTPAAPTAMVGDTSPDHRMGCVVVPVWPVEKCVMVVPAAPLDGKSRLATRKVAPLASAAVQPGDAVCRLTLCRA